MQWPPPYQIRYSDRAKNMRLTIKNGNQLEVVIPAKRKKINVEKLLLEKRTWIEKYLKKDVYHEPNSDLIEDISLPTTINFQALNESWQITYEKLKAKLGYLALPNNKLIIVGHSERKVAYLRLLQHWCRERANQYLPTRLHTISKDTGLEYTSAKVTSAKTRWGSCNNKKMINLNYKLLFLSIDHVDHTILHELCHTVHLDHSEQFWSLLAKFDPNWQRHRNATRELNNYIPQWLQLLENQ